MDLPDFEDDGYDLIVRGGCVFVFAPNGRPGVPLAAIEAANKILAMSGRGNFLDTRLSMIFGANLVAGSKENLHRLAVNASVRDVCMRFAQNAFSRPTGIPPEEPLLQWLAFGDTGMSSLFLVGHLTGCDNVLRIVEKMVRSKPVLPHDDSDLARCVKAIEAQPTLMGGFSAFVAAYPDWAPMCQKISDQAHTNKPDNPRCSVEMST